LGENDGTFLPFHDQVSHPDEWFCSTEQKWKPRSEFNLRDEANGLPQWDCRDCQQKRGRDRYEKNKDQVKNINRVAKLNSREENREYVYNYLYTHPCQDCGASDPRILTFDHVRGTKNPYNGTLRVVVVPPIKIARGMLKGMNTDNIQEEVDEER
jgi:hypothetical protein